ncbi:DUF4176 domain-containing protein [Streptococcus zalophi]|uniref:DUF4176 domain-containing protein n=1 Tax=Streptococcus zalophi TaxID=640031 RepID=A0A934P982_9STRE|nr:DUF4176 domain-containing protein [Streptococcus zalophi]MBJ8349434.1 DUF4176 domain-containing protein [Streptococcus zalophi]MCR8967371.1 DUF4176 domain-containing protein [Streptococcus zalophi]
MTKLLPLGTIVYLQDSTTKVMIIGRGPEFNLDGEEVYSDYAGVVYPEGINPEDSIFFNQENIEKVVFEGFKDEEEDEYLTEYKEWENELTVKKAKM